jgi:large subunit ribosomal protein L25
MSAMQTYKGFPRTQFGGHAAKKLRDQGKIPVTINCAGKESRQLYVELKSAAHLAANVVHLCKLEIEGQTLTTLRLQVVRNTLTDVVENIDLQLVDEKSTIKVDVAVHPLADNCPGVKSGGIVEQRLRKIKVRCPASEIPDFLTVDLSETEIMHSVKVEKVVLPKGVTLVTPGDTILLSVVIPRGMKVGEEEAAAAATAAAAAVPGAEGAAPVEGAEATPGAASGAKPAAGKAAPAAKAPEAGDKKKK